MCMIIFFFIRQTLIYVFEQKHFCQAPLLMEALASKCEVTKISAHPEGKHFMALSREGEVYSWGSGDGGKLGHGDAK